jgi:type I restriction enzyme S subunit
MAQGVTLGSVCQISNGFAFKSKEFTDSGVPVVRISDIHEGQISTQNSACIDARSEFERFKIKKGDLLIALSGATTGKFGRFVGSNAAYLNQRVGRLRSLDEKVLSQAYLYYFLHEAKRQIEKIAYGGAQPNISTKQIASIEVPMPDILEQHRIVEKIEALFAELDKGVEALKTTQQQLKIYRQSVLKHAFEGKLTEPWRAANPDKVGNAETLLQQIQQERQQRYQRQLSNWQQAVKNWEANGKEGKKPVRPKRLVPKSPRYSTSPELPSSWAETSFSTLCLEAALGKMLDKKKNTGTPMPYLRNVNVRWGSFDLDDLLDMKFEPSENERYGLENGDLIVCEGGEPGRCAIWQGQASEMRFQKALHRVRVPIGLVAPEWLYYKLWLLADNGALAKHFTGTTIKHLTGEALSEVPVSICSPAEQQQIIQAIESSLSVVEQLETTLIQNLQKAEALRQSILKKAFAGELVSPEVTEAANG